ncbi:hypothetical protein QR680_008437 [Steinernema hermaphroditum]|uniref:Uncharacterized protein n=1 Tax=Steinernema hermaphroditum TaxID=289476 RepID=A0AA39IIU6_9BILA|nr:hypothetical protein QR680_008437 [Steinernema hermaphroditum]
MSVSFIAAFQGALLAVFVSFAVFLCGRKKKEPMNNSTLDFSGHRVPAAAENTPSADKGKDTNAKVE